MYIVALFTYFLLFFSFSLVDCFYYGGKTYFKYLYIISLIHLQVLNIQKLVSAKVKTNHSKTTLELRPCNNTELTCSFMHKPGKKGGRLSHSNYYNDSSSSGNTNKTCNKDNCYFSLGPEGSAKEGRSTVSAMKI